MWAWLELMCNALLIMILCLLNNGLIYTHKTNWQWIRSNISLGSRRIYSIPPRRRTRQQCLDHKVHRRALWTKNPQSHILHFHTLFETVDSIFILMNTIMSYWWACYASCLHHHVNMLCVILDPWTDFEYSSATSIELIQLDMIDEVSIQLVCIIARICNA